MDAGFIITMNLTLLILIVLLIFLAYMTKEPQPCLSHKEAFNKEAVEALKELIAERQARQTNSNDALS